MLGEEVVEKGTLAVMLGNPVFVVEMLGVGPVEMGMLALVVGNPVLAGELPDAERIEAMGDRSVAMVGRAWTASIAARDVKMVLKCISGIWEFCFWGYCCPGEIFLLYHFCLLKTASKRCIDSQKTTFVVS